MHEGILFVVSVPTSGSNVAFNVVIWLSFLFIKFSSQRSAFFGLMLNVKYVKKVEKGFFDRDVDRTNRTQRRVKLICYMTSDCL